MAAHVQAVSHQIPSEYFRLAVQPRKLSTTIQMKLEESVINTRSLPLTQELLTAWLPGIFSHRCFNALHLPFREEVKATMVAHLFEHIILEYMCVASNTRTVCGRVYKGKTRWNWLRDPYGEFTITMNIGVGEYELFALSLRRGVTLLEKILSYHARYQTDVLLKKDARLTTKVLINPEG